MMKRNLQQTTTSW